MIENWPLLTIITFLPMIGVLFLLMIRGDEQSVARNARHVALWVSGFTFIISLALVFGFDSTSTGYQFEENRAWLPAAGISYHLGVDGISMPFILLSTLLSPLAILASWKAITHRVREYMIAFLVLGLAGLAAPEITNQGHDFVALRWRTLARKADKTVPNSSGLSRRRAQSVSEDKPGMACRDACYCDC